LEIAGGGGSITAWLCNQVGADGHVMATDLDPRFLECIAAPNLEVRRHDILADPLPEASFDLVHTRALLTFLPQPDQAIRKMVAALKPGGCLLIEEPDYVSAVPEGLVTMQLGGTPSARLWRITLEQLQNDILAAGSLSQEELEDYRALLENPEFRWLSPMSMAVRGRRAAA
jgi:SAM-dependent methyltransferase